MQEIWGGAWPLSPPWSSPNFWLRLWLQVQPFQCMFIHNRWKVCQLALFLSNVGYLHQQKSQWSMKDKNTSNQRHGLHSVKTNNNFFLLWYSQTWSSVAHKQIDRDIKRSFSNIASLWNMSVCLINHTRMNTASCVEITTHLQRKLIQGCIRRRWGRRTVELWYHHCSFRPTYLASTGPEGAF